MYKRQASLAAAADEPEESNFVRKHALAYQREHGCTLEIAALRVYGNADGAYGSNVNNLVESSRWQEEDELAETWSRRKGFAYGRSGQPAQPAALPGPYSHPTQPTPLRLHSHARTSPSHKKQTTSPS